MVITKYGHCCLYIEIDGLAVLIDPGGWSEGFLEVPTLDVLLISHEHADHFHVPAVKQLVARFPSVTIMTNTAVGALLHEEGLPYVQLADGEHKLFHGTLFEGHGREHAPIYPGVPVVENTGFFVAERLWYPGDALSVQPEKPVEVLALPVVGPWMLFSDALDYAKALKPERVIPVHDGMLREAGWLYRHLQRFLPEAGIQFDDLVSGVSLQLTS